MGNEIIISLGPYRREEILEMEGGFGKVVYMELVR